MWGSPIRDEARRIATNIAKLPGPALLNEAAAGLGRFKGVLKVLGIAGFGRVHLGFICTQIVRRPGRLGAPQ